MEWCIGLAGRAMEQWGSGLVVYWVEEWRNEGVGVLFMVVVK